MKILQKKNKREKKKMLPMPCLSRSSLHPLNVLHVVEEPPKLRTWMLTRSSTVEALFLSVHLWLAPAEPANHPVSGNIPFVFDGVIQFLPFFIFSLPPVTDVTDRRYVLLQSHFSSFRRGATTIWLVVSSILLISSLSLSLSNSFLILCLFVLLNSIMRVPVSIPAQCNSSSAPIFGGYQSSSQLINGNRLSRSSEDSPVATRAVRNEVNGRTNSQLHPFESIWPSSPWIRQISQPFSGSSIFSLHKQ